MRLQVGSDRVTSTERKSNFLSLGRKTRDRLRRLASCALACIALAAADASHFGPPTKPAAADFSAWDGIDRFRGRYEARRFTETDHHVPYYDEVGREEHVATVEFEIERTESGWRTVRSHVVGQSSVSNRTEAPFRKTSLLSSTGYSGPGAEHDLHFSLDTKTGKWEFGAGGDLAKPYIETVSLRREEDSGGGRWRTEAWEQTYEKTYYAHGNIRGELPGEKPGPLHAVAETVDNERNAGNFDYTTGRNRWEVTLTPDWPDVEVVVKIEGVGPKGEAVTYEDWLPRGTRSGRAGARLKATARLQGRDGKPARVEAREFRFELRDTSQEPGVSINFPATESARGAASPATFDLRFDGVSGKADSKGQIQTVEPRKDREGRPFAEAGIESLDFGAWSTLVAGVELADGRQVAGHLEGDAYVTDIRIPKRSASSFIADAWKRAAGVEAGVPDDADTDAEPRGDGYPGDGLTLYEEYRGFLENGIHSRGDPARKDYFACNLNVGIDAQVALAHFERVTGLAVHGALSVAEIGTEKVVNGNHDRGAHRVDQHGVYILYHGETDVSMAYGGPGTPKQIRQVGISPTLSRSSTRFPGVNYAAVTIAHELLHTVNVWHHGEEDKKFYWIVQNGVLIEDGYVSRTQRAGNEVGIRVSMEDDRDITPQTTRSIGENSCIKVWKGLPSGQHSGNEDCLMRYDCADVYSSATNRQERFYWYNEPVGTLLCTDRDGTGVNAPGRRPQSRYFEAHEGRGNCAGQIRVNDKEDPPSRLY